MLRSLYSGVSGLRAHQTRMDVIGNNIRNNFVQHTLYEVIRVDSKDLAVAIKGSNPEVTAVLYANMPQRMQETIQSDIEYLHNVRMRDVEEAQQRIVAIIRRLEEEGEIVIGKGGKDEIIAQSSKIIKHREF